ncbi:MAG: hypothetical protein B7Y56_15045 [Gallionellales bacterium 35-53-114]|jgi:hypothetical protein|nr:MAG: hypothetical protein B7Y56_15045 [Gallionellales bacterium 35-53-114]OYZ62145.1 MAG: hypothetical protein B7Y04_15495 [Gallionellales bacterium 24-53-125]OZB07293.1 MAG: hypothetical protein B7X61_15125 [Gallionellales bacterium 39-52-133]HQS59862.1 hypothetical protein [Gallionellaceae bacterium]HQS76616.1 hypothetical protein [Gallionellaceae bacterium]
MSEIKLDESISSVSRLLMTILWPSFLMAIISVGILFSMVDPETLLIHGESIELSDEVIYTIGFFIFWFLGALASGLTALLMCKSK